MSKFGLTGRSRYGQLRLRSLRATGRMRHTLLKMFCATFKSASNSVKLSNVFFLVSGYATYMKIQFCVYNRLKYLRQEPVYTLDCMGIGVGVNSKKAE